jgi:bifunctional UDP-N-acetylglucosamine pyrophosphorylase/glucosamine-1-phosphate N-acetyltransferase
MTTTTAIILAAGKGSRFNSDHPKVLQPFRTKPMLHHVIHAVQGADITSICVVVGHKKNQVISQCKSYNLTYATQDEQLGTGHAVLCALPKIKPLQSDHCVVLSGDCPLIQSRTITTMVNIHKKTSAAATILTARLPDAHHYGRILRNKTNQIIAIKEAKECSESERAIQEFNSGIYCFSTTHLVENINKLASNNTQNEYYLTDIIELLAKQQQVISGHCVDNAIEVSGANTMEELIALEQHPPIL